MTTYKTTRRIVNVHLTHLQSLFKKNHMEDNPLM